MDFRVYNLTPTEITNWIAVYAATGVCCAFAMVLSVSTVAYELCLERVWRTVADWCGSAWKKDPLAG